MAEQADGSDQGAVLISIFMRVFVNLEMYFEKTWCALLKCTSKAYCELSFRFMVTRRPMDAVSGVSIYFFGIGRNHAGVERHEVRIGVGVEKDAVRCLVGQADRQAEHADLLGNIRKSFVLDWFAPT